MSGPDDASSLASQLAEAVAADDPVESPAPPEEGAPEITETPPPPEPRPDGRDEKGRFTPKEAPAAPQVEGAAPPTPEAPAAPAADPKSATPSVDVPPDTWSAKGKAAYNTASPDLKAEIWKREQDMRSGLKEYRDGHQIASNIAQACAPYQPHIQAAGSTLMQAIPYALQQVFETNTNPLAKIQQIAQYAGIDLSQLAQQPNDQQQPSDPRMQQLQQQVNQLTQHVQGNQQHVMQQQEVEALNVIQQFRADPKNIYFSNVESQVLGLLGSGLVQGATPAERLSKAYAQACLLNPEVSAAINATQQRDAEQKRLAEAKQKAASAKRAGFDVAGSGALAGKASKDMSIEDSLRANMGL